LAFMTFAQSYLIPEIEGFLQCFWPEAELNSSQLQRCISSALRREAEPNFER
jgi:hypothetical protein